MSYLKRFPLDALRIDRSFVKDLPRNPEDAALTKVIIAMAHSLRLVVVAEGVETEEQLVFLQQHRCNLLQGYLFRRPVSADQWSGMLRAVSSTERAHRLSAQVRSNAKGRRMPAPLLIAWRASPRRPGLAARMRRGMPPFYCLLSADSFVSGLSINSTRAIGALSPSRKPNLRMRR